MLVFRNRHGCFLCDGKWLLLCGKFQADRQLTGWIGRCDAAAHAFGQQLGDGQAQAGGVAGGLDGEEAVEEALDLDPGQLGGRVCEGDRPVRRQADAQIACGVFGGVGQEIVKDPAQGRPVQAAGDGLLRQLDDGGDALALQDGAGCRQALLQGVA